MILKRPKGHVAETPDMLRQRLRRSWDDRVKQHLASDKCSDIWPLEVMIGRPRLTSDAALENAVTIREWINAWRSLETDQDISFIENNRRRFGKMRSPEKIIFADIDTLARYLGRDAVQELEVARARLSDLAVIDPRLSGLAAHWRTLTTMSEEEHRGTYDFILQRQYDPEELLSIREALVAGMDGKFLERRRAILEDALSHIGALKDSRDFRERLGFRTDDRQTLWVKTNPADLTGPFGVTQFAVRPSQIAQMPQSIMQVTIVENIETFFGYEPAPGVCLFFGSGNAIAGMAPEIACLKERRVVYWGDLDSFGLKILSRLRRTVPHAISVMMDASTMTGIASEAWRTEPESDRYTGTIDRLHNHEQAALDLIRAGNHRIEQEHLRPGPDELQSLGLKRAQPCMGTQIEAA